MRLTPEKVRAVRREFRAEEARLVTLDAKRRAERVLRRLPRDPAEVIQGRREALLRDLRTWQRKRRRNKIVREGAAGAAAVGAP